MTIKEVFENISKNEMQDFDINIQYRFNGNPDCADFHCLYLDKDNKKVVYGAWNE